MIFLIACTTAALVFLLGWAARGNYLSATEHALGPRIDTTAPIPPDLVEFYRHRIDALGQRVKELEAELGAILEQREARAARRKRGRLRVVKKAGDERLKVTVR
jgi:hypothetical protein